MLTQFDEHSRLLQTTQVDKCFFSRTNMLETSRIPKNNSILKNNINDVRDHINNAPIIFYSISLKKFILLNILSLGLYQIYWHYKNWVAIKKYQSHNQQALPWARAVFNILFCYFLFKKIQTSAENAGYPKNYWIGVISFIYIIISLCISVLSGFVPAENLFNISYYIICIFSFIPLIFIQKAINYNNFIVDKNYQDKRRFTITEKILLIFFSLWFLFVTLGLMVNPANKSFEKPPITSPSLFYKT